MLSRRQFIAATAALAVAGCRRDERALPVPEAGSTVSFSNRPFAMDGALLAEFEATYGVRLEYHEDIRGEEENIPFERDVVIVGSSVADNLEQAGALEPIAVDDMSHADALDGLAGGPQFTLPWLTTWLVVAYDRDAFDEPPSLRHLLEGGTMPIAFPRAAALGVGAATAALGAIAGGEPHVDVPTDGAIAALTNAAARDIVRFSDRPMDDLARGAVAVAITTAAQAWNVAGVATTLPGERTVRLADRAVIPRGPANGDGALALLNFFYDPAASARLFAAVPAWSPIAGVAERFAVGPRNPSKAVRAALAPAPTISEELAATYTAIAGNS